jgi:hypothetical protein
MRKTWMCAALLLASWAAPAVDLPSNVLVNNPAADSTNQDTQAMCAITRLDATTLVAAFADSGSFIGNSKFTGYSRSTDNGATWTDLGALPTSTAGDAADAHLSRHASSGALLLQTLSFTGGIQLFKSTDGGVTWLAPVNSSPGSATADSPALVSDNFAASPFYGRVYVAYREFSGTTGEKVSVSTDAGATWGPSGGTLISAANAGQGANLVVLPSGTLAAFYFLQGTPSSIVVKRSTDGGATFDTASTVTTLATTGVNGTLGFPYRTNAYPHAAVNPVNGDLYVAYNDNSLDAGDIFFRRSTDHGVTWSGPVKLNDDLTTRAQFHPAIAVTPDGSHLLVAWYDRRADGTSLEYWGVRGSVVLAGVTFGANFPISDTSWAPVYGVDPVVNSVFLTDYEEVAANNEAFDVVWSDGRDTAPVSMRKNQNVRYTRIVASSLRGDVNGDGTRDVSDVFALINFLFAAGPAPVSTCHGDANDSGTVDVADIFTLINFLFASGPAPAPPC